MALRSGNTTLIVVPAAFPWVSLALSHPHSTSTTKLSTNGHTPGSCRRLDWYPILPPVAVTLQPRSQSMCCYNTSTSREALGLFALVPILAYYEKVRLDGMQ